MRKWMYAGIAAISLGGAALATPAGAWPNGGLNDAAALATDVQQAQFIFDDREYCWYDDGWRGPGYYWCGYAWRRGYGWGGGYGWDGRGGGGGGGSVLTRGGG